MQRTLTFPSGIFTQTQPCHSKEKCKKSRKEQGTMWRKFPYSKLFCMWGHSDYFMLCFVSKCVSMCSVRYMCVPASFMHVCTATCAVYIWALESCGHDSLHRWATFETQTTATFPKNIYSRSTFMSIDCTYVLLQYLLLASCGYEDIISCHCTFCWQQEQ